MTLPPSRPQAQTVEQIIDRLKMRMRPATREQWGDINADFDALIAAARADASPVIGQAFDFAAHLQRQRDWSGHTFGPDARTKGVIEHIRKELREIEADPSDISEWIDVVILALDGAWRAGYQPHEIIAALVAKQAKNEARTWPDWRTMPTDAAIEHDRTGESQGDLKDSARSSHAEILKMRARNLRDAGLHEHADALDAGASAIRNEGETFKQLSNLLTNGNAGTWDELFHAAETIESKLAHAEAERTDVNALTAGVLRLADGYFLRGLMSETARDTLRAYVQEFIRLKHSG